MNVFSGTRTLSSTCSRRRPAGNRVFRPASGTFSAIRTGRPNPSTRCGKLRPGPFLLPRHPSCRAFKRVGSVPPPLGMEPDSLFPFIHTDILHCSRLKMKIKIQGIELLFIGHALNHCFPGFPENRGRRSRFNVFPGILQPPSWGFQSPRRISFRTSRAPFPRSCPSSPQRRLRYNPP